MSDELNQGAPDQGSASSSGAGLFGGGAGGMDDNRSQVGDTPEVETQGGDAAPAAAAPAPRPLTADDLAQAVHKIVGAQTRTPEPQRQITREEFEQTFHVFKPTPELCQALGIQPTPEALAGLGTFAHGLVKQAVVMATYLLNQQKQELMGHMQPLQDYYKRANDEALANRFFTQFPDLKGREPLLIAIRTQLEQEGYRGTEAEAFAEVNKRAQQILGQGPASAGTSNGRGNGVPSSGAPRMSGVSTPGQGGAGTGGKQPSMTAGQKVWS